MTRKEPPPLPCLRCALKEMTGSMPTPKGYTENEWSEERKNRLEELKPKIMVLRKEGLNGSQIAKELRLPRSTIFKYIKEIKKDF